LLNPKFEIIAGEYDAIAHAIGFMFPGDFFLLRCQDLSVDKVTGR